MEKTIKKFNELAKVIVDKYKQLGYKIESSYDVCKNIRVYLPKYTNSGAVYFGPSLKVIECSLYSKDVSIDYSLLSKKALETHYTEMVKEWESVKDSMIAKGEQAKLDRIEQLKKELEVLDPSFTKFSSEIIEELHNEQ